MIYIVLALMLTLTQCKQVTIISVYFMLVTLRYQWLHRFDSEPVESQLWEENHRQKHQFIRIGGV